MACTTIASGVLVSLGIIEELTCGNTPAGVGTDIVVTINTGVPSAGFATITRAAGDFIVDEYLPGHVIEVKTSNAAVNDGFWKIGNPEIVGTLAVPIPTVTATTLIVYDPDTEIVDDLIAGPTATLAYEGLRATTRNVNEERDTIESSEVRKSRQFADVRHGFRTVTGEVGYELSLVSYDRMIELAMADRFKPVVISTTGVLSVTPGAPGSLNAVIDRASGSWITDGIRVGDVLRTSGAGAPTPPAASNNRNWVVLEVTSATDILVGVPKEDVDVSAPTAIEYPGRRIDIGTNLNTVTMQRAFNDITKYQVFTGVTVNNMSWTMAPGEPVGGSFDILGLASAPLAVTPLMNESLQPNTPFMSAFDGEMYEGGELNAVVTSMEFTLENNRQVQPVIGNTTGVGPFEGRAGVSGTLAAYFRGEDLFNKFINEEETTITMLMNNPGASPGPGDEFIAVTFPRTKFTSATMDPPTEGPVPMDMGFRSLEANVNDGAGPDVQTSMTIQVSNAIEDERAIG